LVQNTPPPSPPPRNINNLTLLLLKEIFIHLTRFIDVKMLIKTTI
jgi:hypothetical protein